MELEQYEKLFAKKMGEASQADDPAHDLLHFSRVVATAKRLCDFENAKLEVVVPAAWLHDLVNVPKNDPRRTMASQLSAQAALEFLREINYPEIYFDEIAHAIQAHSFSAGVEARTPEAKIVQDADRLDGLGAIGLARCFTVAGLLKRPLYSTLDPFCKERASDDSKFTIDHFFSKLFKTVDTLKTRAGREEGLRRKAIMQQYLENLSLEIGSNL